MAPVNDAIARGCAATWIRSHLDEIAQPTPTPLSDQVSAGDGTGGGATPPTATATPLPDCGQEGVVENDATDGYVSSPRRPEDANDPVNGEGQLTP
jgi:hypothetical protein